MCDFPPILLEADEALLETRKEIMRISISMYEASLFERLPFIAMIFSKDGIIQAVNKMGEDILGYDRLDLIGTHYLELVTEEYKQGCKDSVIDFMTGQSFSKGLYHNKYKKKNGDTVNLYCNGGREIQHKNLFLGIALIDISITDLSQYGTSNSAA